MSQASNKGLESIKAKLHSNRVVEPMITDNPVEVSSNIGDTQQGIDTSTIAELMAIPETVEREEIRLLEERLVVNRSKRKVGEVIVRKEIETRMVEVPVRREKLIIERVGEAPERLAEIDLGEGQVTGIELAEMVNANTQPTVSAEFTSVQKASKILQQIANQPHHGCAKVRLEIVLENKQVQETYQNWFDNYSDS
ncbi:MAG TPA: DUF2382 domain-containing protein [Kamptonema sp.]|nr:DUF2382 domain-containing protein [Kamptonema sp.]